MTTTETVKGVWLVLAEERGQDPASWAALADMLTDADSPAAPAAQLLARAAATHSRISSGAQRWFSLVGPGGLLKLRGLMDAFDIVDPHSWAGWSYAEGTKAVRYVGRHYMVKSQRRELSRRVQAIMAVGGQGEDAITVSSFFVHLGAAIAGE